MREEKLLGYFETNTRERRNPITVQRISRDLGVDTEG